MNRAVRVRRSFKTAVTPCPTKRHNTATSQWASRSVTRKLPTGYSWPAKTTNATNNWSIPLRFDVGRPLIHVLVSTTAAERRERIELQMVVCVHEPRENQTIVIQMNLGQLRRNLNNAFGPNRDSSGADRSVHEYAFCLQRNL